jgi:hypothetical protein
MTVEDNNPRIYLTDCGCVRIETKHSRTTMTIDKFRALARESKKKIEKSSDRFGFPKGLTLKDNVRAEEKSGFVEGKRS